MKKRIVSFFVAVLCVLSLYTALPLTHLSAAGTGNSETERALPEESLAYRFMHDALRSAPESLDLTEYDLSTEEFLAIVNKIYNAPDMFFVGGCSYSQSGGKVRSVSFRYKYEKKELTAILEEFNSLTAEIFALADENWTDLEIVLFYHDYFASTYSYDMNYSVRDAYRFLKERTGVCQAYTNTYQLVLEHFGIPVTYIRSTNLNHIWNAVCLDGSWYVVDVTHDDPIKDMPGRSRHAYFLISLSEYLSTDSHKEGTDYQLGADITLSEKNHPLSDFFKGTDAAFVNVLGKFYGIVSKNGQPQLCQVDVNTGKVIETIRQLPARWTIPGSNSYYPSNYSKLCGYEGYLYFTDETSVYMYDIRNAVITQLESCNSSTRIYGLGIEEDHIVMYTAPRATETLTPVQLKITPPAYYTITWMIGEDTIRTYVPKGELPSFDGSPELEDQNGISYTFIGWSPEIVPATENTSYVALFATAVMYIPGDVNGDGDVNISDVSALLNYLADSSYPVDPNTVDPDGNGISDIGDVTILLNYLADRSVVLQ